MRLILSFFAWSLLSFSPVLKASAFSYCDEPFTLTQRLFQIEYGQSVNVTILNETGAEASWSIFEDGKLLKSGKGNSTGDVVFEKPGNYSVIYSVPAHGEHKAHADTGMVQVLGTRMVFLLDQAVLSGSPKKGQSLDGMTLSVPVQVESYNKKGLSYGPFSNSTTGVTGITVSTGKAQNLKPGKHTLVYQLSGTPTHAGKAFIGFFSPMGTGYFFNFLIAE